VHLGAGVLVPDLLAGFHVPHRLGREERDHHRAEERERRERGQRRGQRAEG
jgi:hypothetical protein